MLRKEIYSQSAARGNSCMYIISELISEIENEKNPQII